MKMENGIYLFLRTLGFVYLISILNFIPSFGIFFSRDFKPGLSDKFSMEMMMGIYTAVIIMIAIILLKNAEKISFLTSNEKDSIKIGLAAGWKESVMRILMRGTAVVFIVFSTEKIMEYIPDISMTQPINASSSEILMKAIFLAIGICMAFAPRWLIKLWGGEFVSKK